MEENRRKTEENLYKDLYISLFKSTQQTIDQLELLTVQLKDVLSAAEETYINADDA